MTPSHSPKKGKVSLQNFAPPIDLSTPPNGYNVFLESSREQSDAITQVLQKMALIAMPNTFLIGVQKAGSTSLYNWLSQHPEIFAPDLVKDYHHFSMEQLYSKGPKGLLSFYKEGYNDEKIILHGAVNYFMYPKACRRIFDFNSDAKLLIILRNPVDRAYSAHNYFHNMGIEDLPFKEAIQRELDGKIKKEEFYENKLSYLGHGFYHKQLSTYLEYFERENIHICIYEDFMRDKIGSYHELCDFLAISTDFVPDFEAKNVTAKPRFKWLNNWVFRQDSLLNKAGTLVLPLQLKLYIKNKILSLNKTQNAKTTVDEDLNAFKDKLRELFAYDVTMLSKFLDKDLNAKWGIKKADLENSEK